MSSVTEVTSLWKLLRVFFSFPTYEPIFLSAIGNSLGPKEFPIALKKIGSYIGKLKNTLSSFQREVSSVTNDLDLEKDIDKEDNNKKKDKTNG
jgi:sec-independent protein translocase protein TatB